MEKPTMVKVLTMRKVNLVEKYTSEVIMAKIKIKIILAKPT